MSSFLKTPERSISDSADDSGSSSNNGQSTPASRRRAFNHASTEMLSSPIRSKRLQAFHDEIRRRRDLNAGAHRGEDFMLYTQYQTILTSLEREADRYAATIRPPDDDDQYRENNDYCHQNDYAGIKDESDFIDEILDVDNQDVDWLVQNLMLNGDDEITESLDEEDDSGMHGSTTATTNDSSFSVMSETDEDMDWQNGEQST